MDTLWLAAIAGDDCPELLGRFSETIALCEGRLLEQHLTGMGGMISGLLRIQLPRLHADYAWQRLDAFAGQGLRILSRQLQSPAEQREPGLKMVIDAPFRPGLDLDIRQILDSHGLAIDDFSQQISGHPDTAGKRLHIRLAARPTRPLQQPRLQRTLSRLAPELTLSVEIEAEPMPGTCH